MAKTPRVVVTFAGDSTGAQKAIKDLAATTGQAEISVAGFGKAFLGLGVALGGAALLKEAADAVVDYSKRVQAAEGSIAALTKSQAAVAQAQAIATREMQAGRAAYSDTLASLDELTPVANRTGEAIDDLFKTSQLLATLNSGPGGGVSGAIIAISEALAGDWTSAIERFNLPRQQINQWKAEGVPALEILNRALAQSGVTMDTVTAKSKTADVQQKILLDTLAKLGAEAGGQEGLDLFTTALIGLNKAAQSDAVAKFAAGLRELVEVGIAGRGWEEVAIQLRKSFFLILNGWNEMLQGISGGRLNITDQLKAMYEGIVADEGKLRAAVQQGVTKPLADELSGASNDSPIAPAKVRGYGGDLMAELVAGMTEGQSDAFQQISKTFEGLFKDASGKTNAAAFAQANTVLAAALHEVATSGQLTERTTNALAMAYKASSGDVLGLVVAYGQLVAAQDRAKLAADKLAAAQFNLQQVQNRAKGALDSHQKAIDAAQKAATDHAQEAADAIEGLQGDLDDVREAAEAAARASAAEVEGLQDDLEGLQSRAAANAAAMQAQADAAQERVAQAQERRRQYQDAMRAALAGEVEYWLRINDITDESVRKVAEKWQAEIDGQRRAKEGADQAVTKLSREANRDERDSLLKIQELRRNGQNAEANREQRALEQRRKRRAAEMEIARAQAAVANDEYEAKAEQLEKEGKGLDEQSSKEERAAQAELTRIQAAAKAQAEADKAAIEAKQAQIRAVQDAAKEESERYRKQQEGIQKEIDKIQIAAREQAKKDKAAITDAQALYDLEKTRWNVAELGAKAVLGLVGPIKTNADGVAEALQRAYEWEQKRYQLYRDNPPGSPGGPPNPASGPVNSGPIMPGGQSPYDEPGVQGGPRGAPPPTSQQPGAPAGTPPDKPPLLDGSAGPNGVPGGYHPELDSGRRMWYVPNGYTLADYGITPAGQAGQSTPAPPSPGGPGGLSRVALAGAGGGVAGLQRASLLAGGPVPEGEGVTIININAPNLRDIRDRRDLDDLGAHIERTYNDIRRARRTKRDRG